MMVDVNWDTIICNNITSALDGRVPGLTCHVVLAPCILSHLHRIALLLIKEA